MENQTAHKVRTLHKKKGRGGAQEQEQQGGGGGEGTTSYSYHPKTDPLIRVIFHRVPVRGYVVVMIIRGFLFLLPPVFHPSLSQADDGAPWGQCRGAVPCVPRAR